MTYSLQQCQNAALPLFDIRPYLDSTQVESASDLLSRYDIPSDVIQRMSQPIMRIADGSGQAKLALHICGCPGRTFTLPSGREVQGRDLSSILIFWPDHDSPETWSQVRWRHPEDRTIAQIYKQVHDRYHHTADVNTECPTCPISGTKIRNIVLTELLNGEDHYFQLAQSVQSKPSAEIVHEDDDEVENLSRCRQLCRCKGIFDWKVGGCMLTVMAVLIFTLVYFQEN